MSDYRTRTDRIAKKAAAPPAKTTPRRHDTATAASGKTGKFAFSQTDPVADWLMGSEYVMYYPALAHMLDSVPAAVLLSKIWYWTNTPTAQEREGWFFWSQKDITKQTGLSKRRTLDARTLLEEREIIVTDVRGVPAVVWWHLEKPVFFAMVRAYIESIEES